MSNLCKCPLGATLPTIVTSACPVNLGQIQKVAFQRLYQEDGDANVFLTADIKLRTAWTLLLAAVDNSKIAITPTLGDPKIEAGTQREFGGGNQTPDGIPIPLGNNPAKFTAMMYRQSQETIALLKTLACEGNLGVYLFSEHGTIGALQEEVTSYKPIPIYGLNIGDLMTGSFDTVDSNAISWSFAPNWSDNFVVVTPDFDPRELGIVG